MIQYIQWESVRQRDKKDNMEGSFGGESGGSIGQRRGLGEGQITLRMF